MRSYNGFSAGERNRVSKIQRDAIRAGTYRMVKKCEMCGTTEGGFHLHNEDYSKPLEGAHPLCIPCHMMLHGRFKFPNKWKRYCLQLRLGVKPKPVTSVIQIPRASGDEPPVDFRPVDLKWWECLSLVELPDVRR